MESFKDINLQTVRDARERISPIIHQTPLMRSDSLSSRLGKNVWLKLENLQPTGAFKLRGAANAVLNLSESAQKRGVVTMSTGNHGRAIAYVANRLGIPATICISALVPEVKVEAMKALGADVRIAGQNQDEADAFALQLEKDQGMKYISPFDDSHVISGQGTVTLEILEQIPEVDTMIVPVSGGGLMGGMALAAKAVKPNIQMVGVTNEGEPAMYTSIKAGHVVHVGESESLADALQGPLNPDNQYTFELCHRYMDEILLVSEEEIALGMTHALIREKQVLEGGGACALALLLAEKVSDLGENIVVVCSGNNVNTHKLLEIADKRKDKV